MSRRKRHPDETEDDVAGWYTREFCRRLGLDYDEPASNTHSDLTGTVSSVDGWGRDLSIRPDPDDIRASYKRRGEPS